MNKFKELNSPEVKQTFGLPLSSEFIGFVIHLPEKDEFISYYKETNNLKQTLYHNTPEHAIKFKSYKKAKKTAKKCKHYTEVFMAYDCGRHIVICETLDRFKD